MKRNQKYFRNLFWGRKYGDSVPLRWKFIDYLFFVLDEEGIVLVVSPEVLSVLRTIRLAEEMAGMPEKEGSATTNSGSTTTHNGSATKNNGSPTTHEDSSATNESSTQKKMVL